MIPNIVTLAQAGGQRAAVTSKPIIPPVTQADTVTIPAARQVSSAGAYFGLFKLCSCGHSSAWHSGAFGDAWRARRAGPGPLRVVRRGVERVLRLRQLRAA